MIIGSILGILVLVQEFPSFILVKNLWYYHDFTADFVKKCKIC